MPGNQDWALLNLLLVKRQIVELKCNFCSDELPIKFVFVFHVRLFTNKSSTSRQSYNIKLYFWFLSFIFLSFYPFVFLSFGLSLLDFCLDITVIKCLKGLKSQKSLFVSKF